jgi:SAM-dependent methyltransferase
MYKAPKSYIIRKKIKNIVKVILPQRKRDLSTGIEGVTCFNRILDEAARRQYQPAIAKLFKLVPVMMARKIPEANIQQAFVLDTVQKFGSILASPNILCVGCYEDTAAESLEILGYRITGIDPALNFDLNIFCQKPGTKKNSFNIIFSTSVIEHVEGDELFIRQITDLLAPGGVAILTCDYNDQYKHGDSIPKEDFRLYTQKDLLERLLPNANDCSLVDTPQWDCPNPDFVYAGCRYTFATFVFRKNPCKQ